MQCLGWISVLTDLSQEHRIRFWRWTIIHAQNICLYSMLIGEQENNFVAQLSDKERWVSEVLELHTQRTVKLENPGANQRQSQDKM